MCTFQTPAFEKNGSWKPQAEYLKKAASVALPMAFEHTILCGVQVTATRIVAARYYARLSFWLGVGIMTLTGALMYGIAPQAFRLLTPDWAVQKLGVEVLRIEMFAEPFFAMPIVAAGALRGAGDTLIPSILNLISMWGIRITVSMLLAPKLGMRGVWIAMCVELCVRGILF